MANISIASVERHLRALGVPVTEKKAIEVGYPRVVVTLDRIIERADYLEGKYGGVTSMDVAQSLASDYGYAPIANGLKWIPFVHHPDPDKITDTWHISDVQSVRPFLTDNDARDVLQAVKRNRDAEVGINWDSLRAQADVLFPNKTTEECSNCGSTSIYGTDESYSCNECDERD